MQGAMASHPHVGAMSVPISDSSRYGSGISHHFGNFLVSDLARRAAAWLVIKTVETSCSKPLAPGQNGHPGDADFVGDRAIIQAICRQKNNLGTYRIGAVEPVLPTNRAPRR
jgi:hypothetical protein